MKKGFLMGLTLASLFMFTSCSNNNDNGTEKSNIDNSTVETTKPNNNDNGTEKSNIDNSTVETTKSNDNDNGTEKSHIDNSTIETSKSNDNTSTIDNTTSGEIQTNDSIFNNWEEIEVYNDDSSTYAGNYQMKIDVVKFYIPYAADDTYSYIALGKDNYFYRKNYSATYNKYYYSKEYKYEVYDSIIIVDSLNQDLRFLIYNDLLIMLGGKTYYKKGEPKVIDFDKMTLELEINNKKVDVTWENNVTVKDLKSYALQELTLYLNNGNSFKWKYLDFKLEKNISDFNVVSGDIVLLESNNFRLYYNNPNKDIEEDISNCTKIGHINMAQTELNELLSSKETASITIILK